jgi:hypothetical protein
MKLDMSSPPEVTSAIKYIKITSNNSVIYYNYYSCFIYYYFLLLPLEHRAPLKRFLFTSVS